MASHASTSRHFCNCFSNKEQIELHHDSNLSRQFGNNYFDLWVKAMMCSKKELINCICLLWLSQCKAVGSVLGNTDMFEKPSFDNSGPPNVSFIIAQTIQLIKQYNIKLDRQCIPGNDPWHMLPVFEMYDCNVSLLSKSELKRFINCMQQNVS